MPGLRIDAGGRAGEIDLPILDLPPSRDRKLLRTMNHDKLSERGAHAPPGGRFFEKFETLVNKMSSPE